MVQSRDSAAAGDPLAGINNHSSPGTGKTVATILAVENAARHGLTVNNVSLIVCPVGLTEQWASQIYRATNGKRNIVSLMRNPSEWEKTVQKLKRDNKQEPWHDHIMPQGLGDFSWLSFSQQPRYVLVTWQDLSALVTDHTKAAEYNNLAAALKAAKGLDFLTFDEVRTSLGTPRILGDLRSFKWLAITRYCDFAADILPFIPYSCADTPGESQRRRRRV